MDSPYQVCTPASGLCPFLFLICFLPFLRFPILTKPSDASRASKHPSERKKTQAEVDKDLLRMADIIRQQQQQQRVRAIPIGTCQYPLTLPLLYCKNASIHHRLKCLCFYWFVLNTGAALNIASNQQVAPAPNDLISTEERKASLYRINSCYPSSGRADKASFFEELSKAAEGTSFSMTRPVMSLY